MHLIDSFVNIVTQEKNIFMKKRTSFLLGLFSLSLLLLMSCATSKNSLAFSELNGEWNIIEINGNVVVPADNQPFPFVSFDTSTGRLSGSSGCNRMMSTIAPGANVGEIVIGNIGSTRMACKDMELESTVLSAMGEVKSYKRIDAEKIALCNASNKAILILAPKGATGDLSALNGEWLITTVNNEAVSFDLHKQPFIAIDVVKESVHGYLGCNSFTGGYKVDEAVNNSISFPTLGSTMMACMDMALEDKVSKALNAVKTYKLTVEGVAFYDANGERIMTLLKK